MSFRIYRLARKRRGGRVCASGFAQTIILAERARRRNPLKGLGIEHLLRPARYGFASTYERRQQSCHSRLRVSPTANAFRLQSERRNSRSASFSLDLSLSNFSVTSRASPRWRRMASRSVVEAPSCISLECSRTPQSGAVRILLAVISNDGMERFFQVIEYILLP